jgi:tetratricopeptide (TPR) repeat protein
MAILCILAVSCSYAQQNETADVHYNRAHALSASGDVNGAIAEYQAALRLKPNYVEALNSLALLYATAKDTTLRDPSKALKYALQAVRLDNAKNPDYLDTLAKAYDANGDHENAILTEQKALALLTEDSTRRTGFESSLSWYEGEDVPTDTAAFLPYCAIHIERCRHSVVDANNITMINQLNGAIGCTIPRTSGGIRVDSREATPKILDWMNANRALLAPKSIDAIEQAVAALWPSECKH